MLNTDDDGFIDNPGSIRRMTGFSEDSFKLLIAKGFLIGFPNGVVAITHWDMQNHIQPAKKTGTVYVDELGMLTIEMNYQKIAGQMPTDCRIVAGQMPDKMKRQQMKKTKQNSGLELIIRKLPDKCRQIADTG